MMKNGTVKNKVLRRKRVKGLCGLKWVQSAQTVKGFISMECEHEDGHYCTTDRSIVESECLRVCSKCSYARKSVQEEKYNE
jgi:hypothetical protein